ncbi:restriction endonuclease subunit S [Vreelandella lionensis]|uniref:Restriction endonuclease subunit S n=1 Tax=Vreelandella lionensis TaxID=1144478 RepID=A0ABW8BSR4_9GAMM
MSWPIVRLGDVAQINPRLPKNIDDSQTVSFVAMASAGEDGMLLNEEPRILAETKKGFTYFENGDVLLAKITPCFENGKCLRPGQISNQVGFGSTEFHVLRADEKLLDPDYLFYMIWSKQFRFLGEKSMSGAAGQKRVSTDFLTRFEIPLPPLEEQKRIATILDKADAIRRKRQQAIQLADEFLRAVFLDMFGPRVCKDSWPLVTFEVVTRVDAPMVDPRDDQYLDMLHIGPDRIEKHTGRLLPALTAREESLISKKFLFDDSYVLYSKIRPYLRKVALPDFVGLCSADMYPIRPNNGAMTREYLWQLLLSDEFTQYTESLPARANIPKLNRFELGSFSFKLPPIDLQKKFSEIFNCYSDVLKANESGLDSSNEMFASLSQKAFSGNLR